MPDALKVAAGSGLMAIAVSIWLWHSPGAEPGVVNKVPDRDNRRAGSQNPSVVDGSPLAIESNELISDAASTLSSQTLARDPMEATILPPLDVSRIARTTISDSEYEALIARLKRDPSLLSQMMDEFRQEQDAERRALLARLLGEAGGARITPLASELIFSGDDESRDLGLQMLQWVQPGNAEARGIASSLLTTEVEPQVLMSTLTVLASPGTVDDGSRALLSDQVALLASHRDAGVRGISLDILSRWSTDGRDTPVLLDALQDPEPRVREAAAYALVGHEQVSETVVQSLLLVVRDVDESTATRRAALMALRSFSPDEAQQLELQTLERELDTVMR